MLIAHDRLIAINIILYRTPHLYALSLLSYRDRGDIGSLVLKQSRSAAIGRFARGIYEATTSVTRKDA